METTRHLYRLLSLAVTLMLTGGAEIASAAQKPNIVFILADDLGYGDLACFGGKDVKTPNIDSLARDGMKLTSFYVHQRCSPSRLAFMTGSYAHRAGTTKVIYRRDRIGINPVEITTPELLKQAGYICGLVGNWHLGDWEPFHPLIRQGDWKLFLKAENPGGKGNQGGKATPAGSLYNVASANTASTGTRSSSSPATTAPAGRLPANCPA